MKRSLNEQLGNIIANGYASDVGLAARLLSGGPEILINEDQPFHPASTVKICIMMEAFRQALAGEMSLDDPLVIHNEFQSLADGSPYSLEIEDDSEKELYNLIGQRFSRRELIRRMITLSSNLASNILLEELNPERVTAFMQALGTEELTILRGFEDKLAYRCGLNNSVTARGFLHILMRLAHGEVVSPAASAEMVAILCQQQFNEMIPAGLPVGLSIAHKTGWAADYYHDVAIIYPPGREPLVLCILTKGYAEKEEADAHAFVAELARTVYQGMLSA